MKNEFDWDLNSIYENEEQIENDITVLYEFLDEIKGYKGKLNDSVDELYNCYKSLEKALEIHEKLYGYAMLKYNQDMSNQESIKLYKNLAIIGILSIKKFFTLYPKFSYLYNVKNNPHFLKLMIFLLSNIS